MIYLLFSSLAWNLISLQACSSFFQSNSTLMVCLWIPRINFANVALEETRFIIRLTAAKELESEVRRRRLAENKSWDEKKDTITKVDQ